MSARMKKLIVLLTLCSLLFAGCSNNGSGAENTTDHGTVTKESNESYFEWDENKITGLTAIGKSQKSIVVPARCEGFTDAVFSDCDVESVEFEDDDDLDISVAFTGSNVKRVVLPDNMLSIPSMAFQMCTSLETVKLPTALKTMENYAFSGCNSLTKVEFTGNQLPEISGNCFENCKALTAIQIPEGVERIGQYAFFGCSALAEVTVPGSVKAVEGNAFGNTALTELRLPEQISNLQLDGTAFGVNTYTMKVLIPAGSWLDENRDTWDIGFGEIVAE